MSDSHPYVTKHDLKVALDKVVEDLTEVIQDGFSLAATKKDLERVEGRVDILHGDLTKLRKEVATKDDLASLEQKLIEDMGALTGAEQKHFDSLTTRVVRLEKHVFPKSP